MQLEFYFRMSKTKRLANILHLWINSCLETDSITCIDSNGILFQAERTEEPWKHENMKNDTDLFIR